MGLELMGLDRSATSIGGLGLIGFLIAETLMKDDAIIPLKLFRSRVFSMSTVLGVLVGFGMFGALLTLPLYLQVVTGLSATESGFATLPLVLGLMIASIASGQIISRTGKYRIFPVTGTAITSGRLPLDDDADRRQAALVPHDRHVHDRSRASGSSCRR